MFVTDTPASASRPVETKLESATPLPVPNSELLTPLDSFPRRHIGPDAPETAQMLLTLGYANLDALIDVAVPKQIRMAGPLHLPVGRGEHHVLTELVAIAAQDHGFEPRICMVYGDGVTPPVGGKNVLDIS